MKLYLTFILISFFSVNSFAQQIIQDFSYAGHTNTSDQFTELNGKLIFFVRATNEGVEMWHTYGTKENTAKVYSLPQAKKERNEMPNYHYKLNGDIYFAYNDNINGPCIWKTDGTAEGTKIAIDIGPGNKRYFGGLKIFKNQLYVNVPAEGQGYYTWVSDGTQESMKQLYDPRKFPNHGATISTIINDDFASIHYNSEPWVSDGTKENTRILIEKETEEIVRCVSWECKSNLRDPSYKVFSTYLDLGCDIAEGLWKTDGIAVSKLLDFRKLFPNQSIRRVNVINNHALVSVYNAPKSDYRITLYSVDLDKLEVQFVRQSQSYPEDFILLNDQLLWVDVDEAHGYELWRSDGSVEGTGLLKDIAAGATNSSPQLKLSSIINGSLYFRASNSDKKIELWRTDASFAGTQKILSTDTFEGGFRPDRFYSINGKLIISGYDDEHNKRLVALDLDK